MLKLQVNPSQVFNPFNRLRKRLRTKIPAACKKSRSGQLFPSS